LIIKTAVIHTAEDWELVHALLLDGSDDQKRQIEKPLACSMEGNG